MTAADSPLLQYRAPGITGVRAALFVLGATALLAGAWARRSVNAFNDDSDAIIVATVRYHITHGHAPPAGLLYVTAGDSVYPSSSGLQGLLAGLAARRWASDYRAMLPRPVSYPDAWYRQAEPLGIAIVALKVASVVATAAVLAMFAFFVAETWSLTGGLLLTGLLATSYWLAWWASNLYWATPLLFLPFVVSWYAARAVRNGHMTMGAFTTCIGGLVFLKALAGYEWLSCILAAASVPIVYYAVRDHRPWRETVRRIGQVAGGGAAAAIAALAVHLTQLASARGSFGAALGAFGGRAGHWLAGASFEPGYPPSGLVSRAFLSQELAALSAFRLPLWLFAMLLPVTATLALYQSSRARTAASRAAWRAAGIALLYSLACSLSWPLLATTHMASHLHLGLIVFFLPSALLLFATPALAIEAHRLDRQPA